MTRRWPCTRALHPVGTEFGAAYALFLPSRRHNRGTGERSTDARWFGRARVLLNEIIAVPQRDGLPGELRVAFEQGGSRRSGRGSLRLATRTRFWGRLVPSPRARLQTSRISCMSAIIYYAAASPAVLGDAWNERHDGLQQRAFSLLVIFFYLSPLFHRSHGQRLPPAELNQRRKSGSREQGEEERVMRIGMGGGVIRGRQHAGAACPAPLYRPERPSPAPKSGCSCSIGELRSGGSSIRSCTGSEPVACAMGEAEAETSQEAVQERRVVLGVACNACGPRQRGTADADRGC